MKELRSDFIKLFFISLLTLLGRASPITYSSITSNRFRGGYSNLAESASLLELLHEIESAQSVDDVFEICESIPAILRCNDKSMRISIAENFDGILAAHALQKIANLSLIQIPEIRNRIGHVSEDLILDRRFAQLTECVDLCIKTLRVSDLARYIWSITSLGSGDQSQVMPIIREYTERVSVLSSIPNSNNNNNIGDLATIMWSLGCIKDTLNIANSTLFTSALSLLITTLYENDHHHNNLITSSPSTLVRILWSMAVYGKYDESFYNYLSINLQNHLKFISTTDIVTLLWTHSVFHHHSHTNSLQYLLNELQVRLQESSTSTITATSIYELDFHVISDSLRVIANNLIISTFQSHHTSDSPSTQKDNPTISLQFSNNDHSLTSSLSSCYYSNVMNDTRTTMFHVIDLICRDNKYTTLPIHHLLSIFRASSALSVMTEPLLMSMKQYLIGMFIANQTISASHAASLLESLGVLQSPMTEILEAPPTLGISMTGTAYIGNPFTLTPLLPRAWIQKHLEHPGWHRIVGRLSAICATSQIAQHPIVASGSSSSSVSTMPSSNGLYSSFVTSPRGIDKLQLLSACWAIAELGHQYRALLRAVRKSIQFALHELDFQSLARLTVAVAEEESGVTVGGDKGITGAKLDREFVDQIALSALRRVRGMMPREQIHCLVAVAKLGRVSGLGWRDTIGGIVPITISNDTLRTLSTNELIPLLWALGRVPGGVISSESLNLLRNEIQSRDLSPSAISTNDILLLVRVVANAHAAKDRSLESSKKMIEEALISHLRDWDGIVNTNYRHRSHSLPHSTILPETPSSLQSIFSLEEKCEILQSLIDMNWFDKEILRLSQKYLQTQLNYVTNEGTILSADQSFHLGRLEELLKIYHDLPKSVLDKSQYHLGKRILSKFLHNIPK